MEGRRCESRSRSRGRSFSWSPSPRHIRSHASRDRFQDRRLPFTDTLLVRNIAPETRPEDLRIPFENFGMVKDVYLPRNYYTGEPRGFGFVKYASPDDAAEAKHFMNHQVINGYEIHIVFAAENRKNPDEMRLKSRKRRRYGGDVYRRHTPLRSQRWRQSYSRSDSPPNRSRSISCESCSSIGSFHDSPPSINRFHGSFSPRGRTYDSRRVSHDFSPPRARLCNYSPPRSKSNPPINRSHDSFSPRGRTYDSSSSRRVSQDFSPPRDGLCNYSPSRSKSCDSLPSRYGYCNSPPPRDGYCDSPLPRDGYCDSPLPRDGYCDSFSSRFMPSENSLRHRAQERPARRTLHGSPPFWSNEGDSSLLKSRPYHSNLFSIQEQIS